MASTNPSSIISGHLYSPDAKLKRGRPPPLLKNACEDVAVGEEPVSSCCVCIIMAREIPPLRLFPRLYACAGVPLCFSNSAWRHDSYSPHVLGTSDVGADNALLLLAVPPHTPLLGTSNIAAGIALHLPAVLPPTHPLLRTCDIAAGTALHLPAVLPSTSPLLRTCDIAAGTALHLPAVLPSTSPFLGTSNIAVGTALHLPAVMPPTHPLLRTCDIAAGTVLHLPAVLPFTILQVVFFGLGSVGSVHSFHLEIAECIDL